MDISTDPVFYAVAFATIFIISFFKGGFGGGFATLGIPFLAFVMPPLDAAIMMAPLVAFMDVFTLNSFRRATWSLPDLKVLLPALLIGLGIGFVAYSPLGRGFLTGAIQDLSQISGGRAAHPRFQEANFAANRALVAKVEAIAAEKGCTPAQLTLAWLLAQGDDVVAIPGTRRLDRLEENVGALAVTLTPDDVVRISAAVPAGAAAGTRYPAGAMTAVQR